MTNCVFNLQIFHFRASFTFFLYPKQPLQTCHNLSIVLMTLNTQFLFSGLAVYSKTSWICRWHGHNCTFFEATTLAWILFCMDCCDRICFHRDHSTCHDCMGILMIESQNFLEKDQPSFLTWEKDLQTCWWIIISSLHWFSSMPLLHHARVCLHSFSFAALCTSERDRGSQFCTKLENCFVELLPN